MSNFDSFLLCISYKAARSPEVIITGTSNFKDRQNDLALDTDALYNRTVVANICPGIHAVPKSVSKKTDAGVVELDSQEAIGPSVFNSVKDGTVKSSLIILQDKNPLVLPLAHNPRFPVSDDDIMHYCAIVDLAYIENVQKYVVTHFFFF